MTDFVPANNDEDLVENKIYECLCGAHLMRALKFTDDDTLILEFYTTSCEDELGMDVYLTREQALDLSETLKKAFTIKTIDDTYDPEISSPNI
tara:strand:- start:443 stop:721 length:279 start_codon:yes stop_codon:yes gene_type:complete